MSEAQNNAIAKELLPNMPQLLHEYKTNKGLKSLIEILSIFNYPNVPDLEKEMVSFVEILCTVCLFAFESNLACHVN